LHLFLLAKDFNNVLELYESCSFSTDVLHSGFGTLSCCLPSCDSFLFLMESLYLLLDFGQLCFFCGFIVGAFVLSVFNLELLEFCIFLVDLDWQRRPRGRLMQDAFIGVG
jgi:hypothetical protein